VVARRAELDAEVTAFHKACDGVYGAPGILADLGANGQTVARKTVAASKTYSIRRQKPAKRGQAHAGTVSGSPSVNSRARPPQSCLVRNIGN
jgi:hypothetical protein